MKDFTIWEKLKQPTSRASKPKFNGIRNFQFLIWLALISFLPYYTSAQFTVPSQPPSITVQEYYDLPDPARCTSNDLDIISADLNLETCDCVPGTTIEAGLTLGVRNNTESLRTSFAFWAQLTVTNPDPAPGEDPNTYYMIEGCEAEILPGNMYTDPPRTKLANFDEYIRIYLWDGDSYELLEEGGVPVTTIPYECGTSLELTNIYQAWTDASTNASRQCPLDPTKINPKCGIIPVLAVGVGLTSTDDHTDTSCNAGSDGTVTITFSGGTPPYQVEWNGGTYAAESSPYVKSNLSAGTYTWKVKDSEGCEKTGSETVGEPTVVTATDDHTDTSCNAGSDGTVTITFSGGTPPYQVEWNGGTYAAESSPYVKSNLSAGTYTWKVKDSKGCEKTGSETVGEPTVVTATDDHTNETCIGGDGSVTIIFSGGTPPYQVEWNGGTYATESSPYVKSNLSAGTYTWKVKDSKGCEKTGSEIVDPPFDCNQLFPTQTECSDFQNCDTADFVQEYLCVDVKKGKQNGPTQIVNVIPGAYFYYGNFEPVQDPNDGNYYVTLKQETPDGFPAFQYFNDANVNIYTDACGNVQIDNITIDVSEQNVYKVIVEYTPQTLDPHVIGVKFDSKSIIGFETTKNEVNNKFYSFGLEINGIEKGPSFGALKLDSSNGCSDAAVPPANNCETEISSTELLQSTQSIQAESLEVVENDVNVSPVPFKEEINLSYDLNYTSDVTIEIFDFGGNLLKTVKEHGVSKGSSTSIGVDFSIGANQMYLIRVTTDKETFVKQVVSSKK